MYKLKIPGEDEQEPNLGTIVDRLPPTLDPATPKEHRFDRKIMGQRYFKAKKIGINTYDLAHSLPL